jgi:hypothetical protein
MLNEIIRYFDLQSARRGAGMQPHAKTGKPPYAPVLPQYAAITLGIIVDPFLRQYIATGDFGDVLSQLVSRTVFALLVAIAILPAVYKNAFDPERPIAVQLAALFVSGLGWQSLFQAVVKVGSQAAGG